MPKFVDLFEAFVGQEADALRDINLMPPQTYVHNVKFLCSGPEATKPNIDAALKASMDRIMEEGYDTTIHIWSTSLTPVRYSKQVPSAYECNLEIVNELNHEQTDKLVMDHLSTIFDNKYYTIKTELEEGSMFEKEVNEVSDTGTPYIGTITLAHRDDESGEYVKGVEAIIKSLIPASTVPGTKLYDQQQLINLGLLPLKSLASKVIQILSSEDAQNYESWTKVSKSFPNLIKPRTDIDDPDDEDIYWKIDYEYMSEWRMIFSDPRLSYSSTIKVGKCNGIKMAVWSWFDEAEIYAYENDIA